MKIILQNSSIAFRNQGDIVLQGEKANGNLSTVGTISPAAGYYYVLFDISDVSGGYIKVTTTLNNEYVALAALYAVEPDASLTMYDVLNRGSVYNTRDNKTQVFDMSQYPSAKYLASGLATGQDISIVTAEWHPVNDF